MANPIRVTIKGSDATGTDAPTVDDLLEQIRDFVEVLRGVERAVTADSANELVWRVTDVTMNSPINVELTPFPTNPAIFIGARADAVEQATARGFAALRQGEVRPSYFTDDVLPKARRMYARVLNGLADTKIAFGNEQNEDIQIDQPIARKVQAAAIAIEPVPYRELGSVEGFVSRAELDGFGRAILRFRARLDNSDIKAVATGKAFGQLEAMRLSDIWQGVRVRVHGTISYKSLGQIDGIIASGIEILDQANLPSLDDINDTNFSGSLTSEEYLEELRND